MISHTQMQEYVNQINQKFSVHACWSGYNIRMFKRKNLVIGGSQDWIYYHNLDVIFKKVIFFNLPSNWSDTEIEGEDLFRLTDAKEFELYYPDFKTEGYHVFAIDLYLNLADRSKKYTCFIVAKNVFLEMFTQPIGDGMIYYEDPLESKGFLCRENRVPFLNL